MFIETTPFPVDYETLQPGDTIPAERLEIICGCSRHSPSYRPSVQRLRTQVQRAMEDRGKLFMLRCRGFDLEVVGEADAAGHCRRRNRVRRREMLRAFVATAAVDVSKLTADERREHERTVMIESKYAMAALSVRATPALEAVRRTVPKMAG